MDMFNFSEAVERLRAVSKTWDAPAGRFENGYRRTPYTILISVLLSFRTKDEVTLEADRRLFAMADRPETMVKLTKEEIEKAIYPVGFYRKKAQTVLDVSRDLLVKWDGKVPSTETELMSLKGVGPKAANIVLESAFGVETVAVDVHVHRILNRWGFLQTKTPEESFEQLKERLAPEEKKGLNKLLVSFGQTICKPVKPLCEQCPLMAMCPKINLKDRDNF